MNFNVLESSVDRYRQSAVRVQLQGIVSIKFTWDTIRSSIWLFYAINVLLSCIPSGCLVENVILLSKLVKNCLSCLMYPNSFLFVALCACVWVWECKKGLKITHFICLNISSFVPIFGLRSFVLIQLKYFGIIRIYSTITWGTRNEVDWEWARCFALNASANNASSCSEAKQTIYIVNPL